MTKHSYYGMIRVLNKKRNLMIADFRHFKRDPVNRKWMPHRAFSHTLTEFRKKIAEIDKIILGSKLALRVSRETGVTHLYDCETTTIYPSDTVK